MSFFFCSSINEAKVGLEIIHKRDETQLKDNKCVASKRKPSNTMDKTLFIQVIISSRFQRRFKYFLLFFCLYCFYSVQRCIPIAAIELHFDWRFFLKASHLISIHWKYYYPTALLQVCDKIFKKMSHFRQNYSSLLLPSANKNKLK